MAGLVLFLSPEAFRPYRLPLAFEELAIVDRRFHIKPLLPLLAGGERFSLLALSQNNVRFFSMSRHAVETVEVPDLPANMKERAVDCP